MRFGGLAAVRDLSFRARSNEITAIIGPNGAGKTTLFNCLTGFYRASSATMRFTRAGKIYSLETMPGYRIAREAKILRTFQNVRLFSGMSVLENLMVAQHAALMRASFYSIAGVLGLARHRQAERAAVESARYWLDRVGLIAFADSPAGSLAYGQQRRLEIARAMCAEPALLCLDEPAAGLNHNESRDLNALLLNIRREHGVAILLIEHDMSVVMQISDHIVVLDHGDCIAEGAPEAVRNNPDVIRAYLGTDEGAV
jgi:branched-chain amino acid transport system ATP-binding protein